MARVVRLEDARIEQQRRRLEEGVNEFVDHFGTEEEGVEQLREVLRRFEVRRSAGGGDEIP